MEQVTKQSETRNTEPESHTAKRIVGVIFAVVEVILAFRLIFKGLGANPTNGFVRGIYGVTQFLVGIFEGIFSRGTTSGAETTAIFEPATLIVMVVIALIAWAVLKLMTPHTGTRVERTEYTEHHDQEK
jgi:heme/copper-type cytochrome/quinol oxidase subunit 4